MIEIFQDHAGVIEGDGGREAAFFTDKVETCTVMVFVCAKATVFIHDSGQTKLTDIVDLVSAYAPVLQLHATRSKVYSSDSAQVQETVRLHKTHQEKRMKTIVDRLKKLGRFAIKYCDAPSWGERQANRSLPTFTASFTPGTGLVVRFDRPAECGAVPDENRRQALLDYNLCFAPWGKEALPLTIQYREGEFAPVGHPAWTVGQALGLMAQQRNHFGTNLQYLLAAAGAGVVQLSDEVRAVVDQAYRDRIQYGAFDRFVAQLGSLQLSESGR